MAVMVKYVVVRNGKEDTIFSTKKEADAYDQRLDIAERLYAYFQPAEIDISAAQLDELTFFMAQHRDPLGRLLKGTKLETAATATPPSTLAKGEVETPSPSENQGSEASKRSQATQPQAAA